MLNQLKFDFLGKLASLKNLVSSDPANKHKNICGFLTEELSVPAAAILSSSVEKHLSVLGFSGDIDLNFNHDSLKTEIQDIGDKPSANLSFSDFSIFKANELITASNFGSTSSGKLYLLIMHETEFTRNDISVISNLVNLLKDIFIDNEANKNAEINIENVVFRSLQELRTPVNTIIGFTSILSEDNLTSSQAEYLTTIKENAQKILLNVNDLLDYVKINTGKVKLNTGKISSDQFLKQVVEVFKNKYSSKINSIKVEIQGQGDLKIDGDDQKLRYAINNILNYLVLTVSKPDILFIVNTQTKNSLTINVKVSAAGLDLNRLFKIFEPFTISSDKEIKEFNLSDISLTLARDYIKLNSGEISVKTGPDGSFNIEISFGGKPAEINNQLTSLPKPTSDNNNILVIEDDYATSKLLSNYLTKWGYTPTLVNSAEQTIELISKKVFLAVIMDIALPNINGLELLKEINSNPNAKNTPVIVCSIETEQQKAFLMGAVEYFVKPINYNYLVEVLANYKLRKESNILCVDDDVPTLNLLKQAVETAGFNAVTEHISSNVMNLIKNKSIDLAIVDLDMPHPNGFELIKMIKSEPGFQNLPIIIYTGKENFNDDLKQIDGMFEDLLSKKSTNLEDLSGIISSMIHRYEEPVPAEKISEAKDGVKILFAEDYKHSQIIVTRLLKKNNYDNIVVVENGEEAYNLAQKEKFDLILMDMQMPVMNGFEATEKIKKLPNYQNIPIIALTAFAMKGDREKCLEAGATDYIPKPIDSKEFLEKVKYYTSAV